MPTIKITDTLNAEVNSVPIDENPLSAIAKYVKTPAVNLVFLPGLVNALKKPVLTAASTPLSLDLRFGDAVELGNTQTEITIGAGAGAAVHVNANPGSNLFENNPFGSAVPVESGLGYLSLALTGSVNAGVNTSLGDLNFGFAAGGSMTSEFFRPFQVTATQPTVENALGEVISNYTIPADIADLKEMKAGDICAVSGSGSFKVSAQANLLTAVNPLASVNLPLHLNPITVKAGASVNVGAAFSVSGEYQVRVRKLDANNVELGYYKQSGHELNVSLTASAGVEAKFGKRELLTTLIKGISKNPEADVAALVNGGLTDQEIRQLEDAITASVNRSLEASVQLGLSAMKSSDAAFLYHVNLSALDATGASAVHLALDGDLTALNALEQNEAANGSIASGISLVRSQFTELRKKGFSMKINLLGILNFSSLSQMIRSSEVVFEHTTGDLTISETVSGQSVSIATQPFRADGEKLRKAMFNSLFATTAYRASRATGSMEMTSSQTHFAFNQNSTKQTISNYLDGFLCLDMMTPEGKRKALAAVNGKGQSNFTLRTEFDDDACQALFLDAAGQPRTVDEYETIGRTSLALLLQPGDDADDPGGHRRTTLQDNDLWKRLKTAGQPTFNQILPAPRNQQPFLGAITSDFSVIVWWASAMRGAAERLADIRQFLANANPATLNGNNEFKKKRDSLQKHMADVVAKSKVQFNDPWGLVALYRAAAPRVQATAIIVSPLLTRIGTKDKTLAAG